MLITKESEKANPLIEANVVDKLFSKKFKKNLMPKIKAPIKAIRESLNNLSVPLFSPNNLLNLSNLEN